MLVVLRIIFGAALVYTVREAWDAGTRTTETGDMTAAFWLAVSLALGIANAAVWAPYLGGRLADPLTGAYTRGFFVEQKNYLLKLVRRLDERGHRRLTLFCCFLEGIHRPHTPTAFIIGLRNAWEGTWLEQVFAREVYRFDNTQNCVWAYRILKRRGINPGVHRLPEVNLTLRLIEKPVEPPCLPIPIPRAPQTMPLERDRQIKLFERDEPVAVRKGAQAAASASSQAPTASSAPPLSPESTTTTSVSGPAQADAAESLAGTTRWQRWRERLRELFVTKRT